MQRKSHSNMRPGNVLPLNPHYRVLDRKVSKMMESKRQARADAAPKEEKKDPI